MRSATFGTILESGGATLYIVKGNKACNAECQKIWPALDLAKGQSKAKAGKGVKRSKLGTKHHAHGVLQVTYNGKALYKFIGDHGHGQVNGNVTDKWGKWSVVVTKAAVASHASATTAPTTTPKSTTTTRGHSTGSTGTQPATSPTSPAPTSTPGTTPPTSPPPTSPPPTTPPTSPPTTSPPTTTPPTTTTTSAGSGGTGF